MARKLTKEETLKLRAFQRQVVRLRQSSIVQQKKLNVIYTTNLNLGTGQHSVEFEGYDPDAFQAQLPILRQFLLCDNINFKHIHNLINQCCPREELVAWTRIGLARWNNALASMPDQVHQHFHQASPTLEEAIKKVFYGYGGLFHVDINCPHETESVKAIEQGMLQEAFPYLWWSLNTLDSVINWWLDKPNEPVPPLECES